MVHLEITLESTTESDQRKVLKAVYKKGFITVGDLVKVLKAEDVLVVPTEFHRKSCQYPGTELESQRVTILKLRQ